MQRPIVLALSLVLACAEKPAPPSAPVIEPTAGVAPPPVVSSSPPAPPPVASARPAAPTATGPEATPPVGPEPVPCKTVDDCWIDGTKPVARPKNLRGKKLTPCKGTEHTPACDDGKCVARAWKC